MTVFTTPVNPHSDSEYRDLWIRWTKSSPNTFCYDLFKTITMGNIRVAQFIIQYCTTARRSNFILYLHKQGYSGDALYHLIFDVCSGSNGEMDKLMLKMEQRIVNTNDLNHLTSEHRKIRYL